MNSKFLRICSMILSIVMVINLLPMQALGETVFADEQTVVASNESLSANVTVTARAEEEPAYIVGEIEANRTEYSKEYRLSNGLNLAVVYDSPVHYDNNGAWAEIDNTLKATTEGTYINTAGVWQVALPQQMTANAPVTITKDGYTLSFVLAGELNKPGGAVVMSQQAELSTQGAAAETFSLATTQTATAQLRDTGVAEAKAAATHPETVSDKLVSRLAYQNVFSNTGITYDLDSNKVKESVILNSYNPNLRGYKYTLNVGELIPVLYDDGHIDFFNADKTDVVMVMPAPFLVDAAYAYNEDIQVQLVGKGSTYTLTYILPQSWLADESRQWPVILDPVVSADTSNSNIQDQEIAENTTISHTRGVMEAGYGANGGIERFFIKYVELPEFTAADVIVHAQVSLMKPNNYPTSAVIQAHQVTEDWSSTTITWADHPDWNTTIEDYKVVKDAGTYTWEITNIVRGWYETGNYGVMFKASDEVEEAEEVKWMQFYSSDCGFSSGRPALQITYQSHNGLESYWDYTSASAGRAGTGSVNNYTGNLVWTHGDIGFGGNRAPVSISHVYNTNDIGGNTDRYGTGAGWKTSMNQRVYPCEDDDTYYLWEDGDGTVHYLEKRQDGLIVDINDPKISFNVRNHSDTHYFRIAIEDGPYYYFDNMRRLTRIEDVQRESNCIDITYAATNTYKISTVTDGAGRVYTYNYNSSGLLSYISYTGTGTTEIARVSFGYTNGNLTSITDIDGKISTFTYENKRLTQAQDYTGLKLQYTYDSAGRVNEIKEYDGATAGGHMTIAYGHNQTVLHDMVNDLEQITQFNDFGNVISVQDELGRAQYAQYTKMSLEDTGAGSQLRLASKLQNTVNNLFEDHSFENGADWGSQNNVTTQEHYLGAKALTVTNGELSETEAVTSGKTYTFSAWVKTDGGPAYLTLGTAKSLELKADSDWTRLEVSYTATSDSLTAKLVTTGTACLDCVQLEEMAAASRYNLLENSDFAGGLGSSWTGSGFSVKTAAATAAPHLNDQVLSVTGDPEAEKRLSQTLNISGAEGDSFVLAGWAKGRSVPLDDDRTFGIEVTFNYTETVDDPAEKKITFNPHNRENTWQYAAAAIVAEKAYTSVTVTVTYDYNANEVMFDGIQLFKEVFGSSYTYDENGNVISSENLQKQTTTYEYDSNNNLVKTVLPTGAEMTYTYDAYKNVKTATTAEGLNYRFEYDHYGNNTKVSITSDGKTISSTGTYTADGNYMTSSTDALGNTVLYSYNADTGILEWTQGPEQTEDTRTEYTYDLVTYLLETVESTTDTGLNMSVDYTYDTENLLTKLQTPTTAYQFAYGVFNLRQNVTIGNRELAKYTYDSKDYSLLRLDYGNGDNVQYKYDDYGRILLETYEDEKTISYQYDNDGALAAVTDSASGITTRQYFDMSGRSVGYSETANNFTHSVGYAYDEINNLTQLVENINGVEKTTSYTYDDDNRTTSVTTDGITVEYTYDAFGRVTQQVTKLKGETAEQDQVILTEYFTFTEPSATATSGQVATYRTVSAGLDITYSYTYDANGNILTVSDGTNVTGYTYDTANQLVREDNQQEGKTYTWTYDNAGNILTFSTYAYTTGALGTATTVNYEYKDKETNPDGWGDLLTALNGQSISYDTIGNPLNYADKEYTWQHGRQLATLTENNTTWNYTYNNAGLRTGRYVVNGASYKYIYNGSQLVQMTVTANNSTQVVNFTYDAAGTPLTMKVGGATYYYITNLQGDVMGLVNASGATVVSYAYTAYGVVTSTGDSAVIALNPLTYRGYVYDSETGLYYLQSRYYDPEIGRFINSDTLFSTGQGLRGNNMFAYCLNNPVVMADDSGHDAIVVVNYLKGQGGLPIVGHIYVYVQNTSGSWIMTEYASYTGKKKDAKIYSRFADEEEINALLKSDSGWYGFIGIDTVYIEGDFSKSAALAWEYLGSSYGKYCGITNNCKHYAHEILMAGTPESGSISDYLSGATSNTIVPRKYINHLTLRKEFGDTDATQKNSNKSGFSAFYQWFIDLWN